MGSNVVGNSLSLKDAWQIYNSICKVVEGHVFGRDADIKLILTALFAGGHVLLEDYPGSGKSYMAEIIGACLDDDMQEPDIPVRAYKRIQCTPDLLPSDITGYITQRGGGNGKLFFCPGPIFAHVLLLDEINRTTPKVQSALLEAMAEKQVSVDGETHKLGLLFFVMATENPLDHIGTYPLPAAQLDRFLFKRTLQHLNRKSVEQIMSMKPCEKPNPVVAISRVLDAQRVMAEVDASAALAPLLEMREVIEGLTQSKKLKQGSIPSPRALQRLIGALKVAAVIRTKGDEHTRVDAVDIRTLAFDFFQHRLILARDDETLSISHFISDIVDEGIERASQRTKVSGF